MSLNLKSLVGKLTDNARRGLEGAAGLCLSRTHYEVELEHWFMKLGEGTGGDFDRILRRFEIDPDRFLRDLDESLDQYKTGNGGRPQLAPSLEDVMREGWVLSSINLGTARVRSGALLLAALNDRHLQRRLLDASPDLRRIKTEVLERELAMIVAGSPEDREVFALGAGAPVAGGAPGGGAGGAGAGAATPALDQFTIDLTAEAQAGRVDPVLGRDAEIRQIIDILTRRRQNNPILTGEAGVGKTAVVEGFALRIAAGDVPPLAAGRGAAHARPRPAAGRRRRQGRVREPAQAGDRRSEGLAAADHPVHRRGAHHDRRRRPGGAGRRRQPAQAGPGARRAAHHRRHHLGGVQEVLREGRRAGAALPGGQGRGADREARPSR